MVDFPRGGGSTLTPAERREISDIVKKEYNENGTNIHDGDDDDSLPLFRQGTKKRKADHEDNGSSKASAKMLKQKRMARNSNSKKQLENDASENEDEMLSSGLPIVDLEKKSIETLNYKVKNVNAS